MDEAQLVRRCQAGDEAAFEALFARHSRRVLQTAYLITGSPTAAEDILQEAFTQTFRAITQLREPAAFSAWLYRTTVRAARKALQREQQERQATVRVAGEGERAQPPQDAVEVRQLIWAAISALPEQQRIAVILHYFQDRSVAEIAQVLEAPEGTVKSWLHRARGALASQLGVESHG